jgi:Flp pilus assembly protein TadB
VQSPLDELQGEITMKLRVNEGPIDRIARIAAGAALIAVAVLGLVASPLTLVAGVVGAILLVTGAVGFCPLYAVFGISTCPAAKQ